MVDVLITTSETVDMAPNSSPTIMLAANEVGEAAAGETLLANMVRGATGTIDVTATHHLTTPTLSIRCTLETATMGEVILATSVISLAAVAVVTETAACSTTDDLPET